MRWIWTSASVLEHSSAIVERAFDLGMSTNIISGSRPLSFTEYISSDHMSITTSSPMSPPSRLTNAMVTRVGVITLLGLSCLEWPFIQAAILSNTF
jgi:hypothetical protein